MKLCLQSHAVPNQPNGPNQPGFEGYLQVFQQTKVFTIAEYLSESKTISLHITYFSNNKVYRAIEVVDREMSQIS